MIDENGEHDNNDLYALWGVLIGLYLLGTAIVVLGWMVMLLLAGVTGTGWVCIVAYLKSEERRYRRAQRELRQHQERMRQQLRRYR